MTAGDIVLSRSEQKIFRLEDGRIVATSGLVSAGAAFRKWIAGGEKPELPDTGWQGWVITSDGKLLEYDDQLAPVEIPAPHAMGSGWIIAKSAMALGKTAKEAVELACELNVWTAGPVQAMEL